MITYHQPKIFGNAVIAAVSSRSDGDMKYHGDHTDAAVTKRRQAFLMPLGIELARTYTIKIAYNREDYTVYKLIEGRQGEIISADALASAQFKTALFLPLADCVGAILYDPTKKVLMVSHLGRHSIEQLGGLKSVRFLQDTMSVQPSDLLVWLSPAAAKERYPMKAFNGRGMHEVIVEQLFEAGVRAEHIEIAAVDTLPDYFSHSAFIKGEQLNDERFAIVAMMVEQGEPA